MKILPIAWRVRLSEAGLMPTTRLARVAWYFVQQSVLLLLLQRLLILAGWSYAQNFTGSLIFIGVVGLVLYAIVGIRLVRARVLWRLRNRLIVTYVFIGVIPVVLLIALALGSFYLFAGQFATFIVTTSLNSEIRSLDAANSALAHEIAARLQRGAPAQAMGMETLRRANKAWSTRHVHVWQGSQLVSLDPTDTAPTLPSFVKGGFHDLVRDKGELFLRACDTVQISGGTITVLSSEPLDKQLLQALATNLGEVTLYTTGFTRQKIGSNEAPADISAAKPDGSSRAAISVTKPAAKGYELDTSNAGSPTYVVGTVPQPTRFLDRQVSFPTTLSVVNWDTGDTTSPAAISVHTRVSQLYDRLFGALGDFSPAIEYILLIAAIILAVIELIALFIGTRLTRTVTGAVAQLYEATKHINRGDFRHRIPVRSDDQIATLATSFNSMTTSLEQLIEEQKEKQRLEGELAIAQEVQEQLYPRELAQLPSLEVHGFCKPARTVSGDYYDFLALDGDRLLLAVGDISGKGISAALLMATIHSAVRAYSLERLTIGAPSSYGGETSPGNLLALLNHQLYESTPMEKYATLFLAAWDGGRGKLTYSNGGHLPPLVLSDDGSVRRLDQGGTVVGLFDDCAYDEDAVKLRPGDLFIAYSDGVTEPENDFGEFGEERLLDLVRENRDLPLVRITDIVINAVADWIGANEQPDDITVVLARAR